MDTDWNENNETELNECSVCGEIKPCQLLSDLRIAELAPEQDNEKDNPAEWICLDCQKNRFRDL